MNWSVIWGVWRRAGGAVRAAAGSLTPRGWGLLAAVIVAVVIWLLILAWGQARYDAGRTSGAAEADARWRAAAQRLEQRLDRSAAAADRREADRIRNHQAAVAEEKEKIDEAVDAGRSPLDVLFGGL